MANIFQYGLYMNGFDDAPTSAIFTQLAHGTAVSSPTPFTFGYGWQLTNINCGILLGEQTTTLYIGSRLFTSAVPGGASNLIYGFYDSVGAGFQCTLKVTSTGALQFCLGNTATTIGSASSAGTIVANQWSPYIEAFVTIGSGTNGSVTCKVNGTTVITATGVTTETTGNIWCDTFQFSAVGTATTTFDDWYMLDGTGSAPFNSFLCPVPASGILQVRGDATSKNSSVGGRNAWTPTTPTGVNWQNNANIPASATENDADSTAGDYDMFGFPNLPSNVTSVLAINNKAVLLQDAGGTHTLELNTYSNGTDSATAAFTPATTATNYNQVSVVDPHTSSAWTVANAGAVELGVKTVS